MIIDFPRVDFRFNKCVRGELESKRVRLYIYRYYSFFCELQRASRKKRCLVFSFFLFSSSRVVASDLSLSLSQTRDREVPAKAQERTGIITEQRALFFHVSRRCLPSLHLISLTRRQEVREGLTLRDVIAVLLQTLPEEFHRCCTRVGPRVDPTRAIISILVCVGLVLFVRLVRDRPRTHDAIDSAMADRRASAPHHSLTNHVRHGPEQRGSTTVPASGRWRRRAGLRPRLRRGPARETATTATSSAHVCFVSCASKKCDEMVKIHSCAKQKS